MRAVLLFFLVTLTRSISAEPLAISAETPVTIKPGSPEWLIDQMATLHGELVNEKKDREPEDYVGRLTSKFEKIFSHTLTPLMQEVGDMPFSNLLNHSCIEYGCASVESYVEWHLRLSYALSEKKQGHEIDDRHYQRNYQKHESLCISWFLLGYAVLFITSKTGVIDESLFNTAVTKRVILVGIPTEKSSYHGLTDGSIFSFVAHDLGHTALNAGLNHLLYAGYTKMPAILQLYKTWAQVVTLYRANHGMNPIAELLIFYIFHEKRFEGDIGNRDYTKDGHFLKVDHLILTPTNWRNACIGLRQLFQTEIYYFKHKYLRTDHAAPNPVSVGYLKDHAFTIPEDLVAAPLSRSMIIQRERDERFRESNQSAKISLEEYVEGFIKAGLPISFYDQSDNFDNRGISSALLAAVDQFEEQVAGVI